MRRPLTFAFAAAFAFLFALPLRAVEIVQKEGLALEAGGRFQILGTAEKVTESNSQRGDDRVYLFEQQARLYLQGVYNDVLFRLELANGGEALLKTPNPGVSLGLLDMFADIPLTFLGPTHLRVGQFKVPYSRERLSYSGVLDFTTRSIQNLNSNLSRDVGIAIHTYPGIFSAGLGLFTGGGRDVPVELLPERLGVPLVVLRVGVNMGQDQDVFATRYSQEPSDKTTFAFYLNGAYMQDTLLGHSSVLNVRLADPVLLLDSNWNPLLSKSPLSNNIQGKFWTWGADVAFNYPLPVGILEGEAEVNYAGYSNPFGSLHSGAGRVQGRWRMGDFQVALRYAALVPDRNFSSGGAQIIHGDKWIQELTPAITYFIRGDNAKVIAELPTLYNVPVSHEPGVGSYVLTEMPDETTVIAKGSVDRQTVIQARLLFQAAL